MKIEQRVIQLVEEKIDDRPELFLVDVKMQSDGKLVILVDGDNGISIQDCVAISRHVGYHLEENNEIEHAYTLEVSSPGIDTALKLMRQYQKNTGRNVNIKLKDGTVYEGKLLDASELQVRIERAIKSQSAKEKKGKKIQGTEQVIPFDQIVETKVLISLK
ncbi:MAG TPA: ribosome assembly cofactor RimP [Sphingobacteriaceae bacterium]|nr:ribosome assembly cofactor RimP [Sphingobacteriaceae bacterium]